MTYHAETRVFPVDPQSPDTAVIADAAAVLQHGGLVAFPTETVYGLGANALDPQAVSRIFAAKGRPASDPLIVHIADLSQLETVARDVPPLALSLAAQFWPGPLTLILRRGESVPMSVSAGTETVGVRMPRHPVALALLRAAGVPVAAPSANLFSRPSPTTAQHVLEDLRGRVDVVLDAGSTDIGVESTVLDLTSDRPRVLRPGGIALEQLQALVPGVAYTPQYLAENAVATGPGMLLKHYSPRAKLVVFAGNPRALPGAIYDEAKDEIARGQRVGLMLDDDDLAQMDDFGAITASLGRADDPVDHAQRLFAALRSLDAQGVDIIFTRDFPQTGLGLAIWDRLRRAAEGRFVMVD